MFENSYIELFDKLFITTKYLISLSDIEGHTLYCQPSGESYLIPADLLKLYIDDYISKNINNKPYIYTTKEGIYIGVIGLLDDKYLVIGPSMSRPIHLSKLYEKYENVATTEDINKLRNICINYAKTDSIVFSNLLSTIYELIYRKSIRSEEILAYSISDDIVKMPDDKRHIGDIGAYIKAIKDASSFEEKLYLAISHGNNAALDEIWGENVPSILIDVSVFTATALLIMIPYLTIMRRAAIMGGADETEAFELHDLIIKKISTGRAMINCVYLITEASYDFCKLVNNINEMGRLSRYAKKCEKYINANINKKITIKELAAVCEISERQINRVFLECFNKNVNKYINAEKMRQAQIMLDDINNSIVDVSKYLGYSSQSHFTNTFNKYVGCTPKEYKNKSKST